MRRCWFLTKCQVVPSHASLVLQLYGLEVLDCALPPRFHCLARVCRGVGRSLVRVGNVPRRRVLAGLCGRLPIVRLPDPGPGGRRGVVVQTLGARRAQDHSMVFFAALFVEPRRWSRLVPEQRLEPRAMKTGVRTVGLGAIASCLGSGG